MGNSGSIAEKVVDFINELVRSMRDGNLFFGSSADIVRYVVDILLVAFLFYWFLIFLKHTRAWQLIKGITLIFLFVVVCSFFGLEMVGFLFNKLLYVFAFAVIVLFQPELRRVLETVGILSFGRIKSTFGNSSASSESASLINEICSACKEMSKTYTGALILIERTTSLDDLLTQENVVRMDSSVSSSVLQSIFYKGAPMHDGAVLIRNNRIVGTRCHVPLSVTMQQLERSGTRHRAAVGASEIGDTIAVVVSEERGKTSIAVNGRLFEMKDSKELEDNLAYLLGLSDDKTEKSSLSSFIRGVFGKQSTANNSNESNTERKKSKKKKSVPVAVASAVEGISSVSSTSNSANKSPVIKKYEERQRANKISLRQQLLFVVASLVFSLGLWVFIQINNNPIIEKKINIPISFPQDIDLDVSYNVSSVDITVVGRQKTINMIDSSKITATYDYSQVKETGPIDLPIIVVSNDPSIYFRVIRENPDKGMVNVYSLGDD